MNLHNSNFPFTTHCVPLLDLGGERHALSNKKMDYTSSPVPMHGIHFRLITII